MSITMSLLSHAISLLVSGLGWVYRTLGIKGILVILIVAEVAGIAVYYEMTKTDYLYMDNYAAQGEASVISVSPEDALFEEQDIDSDLKEAYYVVTVPVENKNSGPMREPYLEAKNQKGDYIASYRIDYYNDGKGLADDCSSVIPGGVTARVNYLIALDQEAQEETTEVSFFDWRKEDNPEMLVTVTLPVRGNKREMEDFDR